MRKTFKNETGAALSLTEFLSQNLAGVSLSAIKKQISLGEVRVDGVKTKQNVTVSPGSEISIFLPSSLDTEPVIETVFADDNIIATVKPRLMDTEHNLKRELEKKYGALFAVHRLDTNTEGLVLFARNSAAAQALTDGFRERKISKFYEALVEGTPEPKKRRMTAWLIKDPVKKISRVTDSPEKGAVKIVTAYEIIGEYDGYSKLAISIETGKMHQIRAHMAFIGHPVLGDGKYGNGETNKKYGYKYQQLTAVRLRFGALKSPLSYLEGKTLEYNKERKKH